MFATENTNQIVAYVRNGRAQRRCCLLTLGDCLHRSGSSRTTEMPLLITTVYDPVNKALALE
jgi:hypothetical protein